MPGDEKAGCGCGAFVVFGEIRNRRVRHRAAAGADDVVMVFQRAVVSVRTGHPDVQNFSAFGQHFQVAVNGGLADFAVECVNIHVDFVSTGVIPMPHHGVIDNAALVRIAPELYRFVHRTPPPLMIIGIVIIIIARLRAFVNRPDEIFLIF